MTDSTTNGDHPAYPVTAGQQVYATGMSLRDAAALAALAAWPVTDRGGTAMDLARKCYALADAFIAAREEKTDDLP